MSAFGGGLNRGRADMERSRFNKSISLVMFWRKTAALAL
jgi:hypothetical protein